MAPSRAYAWTRLLPLLVALGLSAACSSDRAQPIAVLSLAPADGATDVALDASLTVTFSRTIDQGSVDSAAFALEPATAGALQVSNATVTFTPAQPLLAATRYTATAKAKIRDPNGVTLGSDHSWSFTTVAVAPDTTPPAAVTTLAAAAASQTSLTVTWVAVGDDGLAGTATSYDLRWLSGTACPITAANFATGTPAATGAPKETGQLESVTVAGLQPSTSYCFGLIVKDEKGNASGLSNLATASTGNPPDTTPPAAVTDLAASATSAAAIHLTWTAPGNDGGTGTASAYDLRRASGAACPINAAGFAAATAVTVPAPHAAGAHESFDATGLTAKTLYCFAIKARDAANNVAAISNVASATTGDATPPSQVTDLAASAASGTVVHLSWTAPGDDGAAGTAAAYDLRRASGTGCPIDTQAKFTAATAVTAPAPLAGGSAQAFDVTGLADRTTHCFALEAKDAAGNVGPLSNSASATTPDATPPAAVTDLAAAATSPTAVRLTWTAPGNDGTTGTAAAYDLRVASGAACPLDTQAKFAAAAAVAGVTAPKAPGSAESLDVTGLADRTGYCFALETRDAVPNVSGLSNSAAVTTPDGTPPAAVNSLHAAATSGTVIHLTWIAPGDNGANGTAASYDLRRATGAGCPIDGAAKFTAATPVAGVPAPKAGGSSEAFDVTGLAEKTDYCFAIKATDAAGNLSALSNPASATTPDATAPAPIANLAASATSASAIHLTWTAPGDDGNAGTAAAYDLRRLFGAGCPIDSAAKFAAATPVTGVPAPKAAGSAEAFDVAGLNEKTTYCFAIETRDAVPNVSVLSNSASATTLDVTPPAAVADLAGAATSASVVHLTWTAPGDDGTSGTPASYDLRRATGAGCPIDSPAKFTAATAITGAPSPHVAGTPESFDVTGLGEKTAYCFVLETKDAAGNTSGLSNSAAATTQDKTAPAAVADLAGSAPSDVKIHLTWTAPGDDGAIGTAAAYDLRMLSAGACPISPGSFASATAVAGLPAPKAAGGAESFDVTGLTAATAYCFAIKTADAAGNVSALSNVASATTRAAADITPPAQVTDLAVTGTGATTATLTWHETADDGATGAAAARADVYAATGGGCPITSVTGLTAAGTVASPVAPGSLETLQLTGLGPSTAYCFVVVVSDAAGNASAPSNVATGSTTAPPDLTPPAAVQDLAVESVGFTSVTLTWHAPGDDGNAPGTMAASYDLRLKAAACPQSPDETYFQGAQPVAGLPSPSVEGTHEAFQVTGLTLVQPYCFLLKATDAANNTSGLSNAVTGTPADTVAPDAVTIAAAAQGPRTVTVSWLAPEPHDPVPGVAAEHYELRYLTGGSCPIDGGNFATGAAVQGMPQPAAPTTAQQLDVIGLQANLLHCFAMRSFDAAGNPSAVSAMASATTGADVTPPAQVITLAVTATTGTGATLTWTEVGDDGSLYTAASADVFAVSGAGCSIADVSGLTPAKHLASVLAPGALETVSLTGLTPHQHYCFAVVVTDHAGLTSGISNVVTGDTKDTLPPADVSGMTVDNATQTSLRINWTAPADDDGGAVAGYDLRYSQGACTGFSYASATPSATSPAQPPASAESTVVSGLGKGATYCFGIRALDGATPPNASVNVATAEGTTLPPTTSDQIQAVRAAIQAGPGPTVSISSLPITGAVVSYVKANAGSQPDGPGFFVQNLPTGPALYVGLDPASFLGASGPTVAVGDKLDLTITQAKWLSCPASGANLCSGDNSLYVVTGATGVLSGSGTPPTAQTIAQAADLGIAGSPWAYDSELISGDFAITDVPATAGTGFQKFSLLASTTTSTALVVLRTTDAVVNGVGLANGCSFHLAGAPAWRNTSTTLLNVAQVHPWNAADLGSVSCPAPSVASSPANGAVNIATNVSPTLAFSQPMLGTSIVAASADCSTGTVFLSKDNFTTCVPLTISPSANGLLYTATLGSALSFTTVYTLKVSAAVSSASGGHLASDLVASFTTSGNTCTPNQLVISQVYGGGGNSGSTLQNDFVEIHNRGSTAVDLTAFSVQYGGTAGTSWSVHSLATVPAGIKLLAPGAYFTIREAAGTGGTTLTPADFPSGTTAGPLTMGASNGLIALVSGTTALTSCNPSASSVVDFVGYGTASCAEGGAGNQAPAISSTLANWRGGPSGDGCGDTTNNKSDFATGGPSPRLATGTPTNPVTCSCP